MNEFSAKFDGFTLRAPHPCDLPALERWIQADETHRGVFTPEHFLGTEDPHSTVMVMEDEAGRVMFIRIARVARVEIQFPPDSDGDRIRRGLVKGMAAIEAMLSGADCEQWIFQTQSRPLRIMAKRDLGFRESPGEMVRAIAPKVNQQEVN